MSDRKVYLREGKAAMRYGLLAQSSNVLFVRF